MGEGNQTIKKRIATALLAAALAAGLTGCAAAPAEDAGESLQVFAMDTVMELTAYGDGASDALARAQAQIRRLETLLSRTDPDSQISRLNDGAGTPVPVGEAVYDLVSFAMGYSLDTGGAFDVTVAPVVRAWGFTTDTYQVPAQPELDELLTLVDSSRITKDPGSQPSPTEIVPPSVTLAAGQSIDLGGIAKGYASDCVEEIFRGCGLERGKIELGGNVYVQGTRPDGKPWRVGVQDPARSGGANAFVGILHLTDAYAITSGGYQRYFEQNGKRYHHIIDPATGYPAESGLVSVTVVAPGNGSTPNEVREDPFPGNGTMCDAFSTALFVMGEARAIDFWRSGGYDFDLVLVTEDGRVVTTAGLEDRFTPSSDGGYAYEIVR